METWSNEELVERWNKVSVDFQKAVDEVSPHLVRISKLEMELLTLKEEILKRGISNDKESG